ncbi:hypothetical protein CEXT_29361 [Caerostris extrusa]|uniref:Uncharacterized protein n=1 Tax=Caerostris extrusa TaxID=172846 RepID=A0AAV4XJR0_CAEEX|nr:hypothetical protein CEXT_29361 [Caerostris extrusa]
MLDFDAEVFRRKSQNAINKKIFRVIRFCLQVNSTEFRLLLKVPSMVFQGRGRTSNVLLAKLFFFAEEGFSPVHESPS